jgi:uncharacterized membrane protein YfcA
VSDGRTEPRVAAALDARVSAGRALALLVLGALIGTYSTLCGIGGGIFAVPLLHYVYGMPLKAAVANSLVLVAASTASATLVEALRPDSVLSWSVLLVLAPASLVGTQLGYRVAQRIQTRELKLVFSVVLALIALKVLLEPAPDGATLAELGVRPSLGAYAIVAVVGLVAGILAPLLGIGGGLVAVPGLLLGVPGLGYAAARACSTAMSVVNSWQSVWLYRRTRLIDVPTALWFAGGALAGGVAGDLLIHVESVLVFAQKLLSLTLLFVALRFAWDVVRGERGPS